MLESATSLTFSERSLHSAAVHCRDAVVRVVSPFLHTNPQPTHMPCCRLLRGFGVALMHGGACGPVALRVPRACCAVGRGARRRWTLGASPCRPDGMLPTFAPRTDTMACAFYRRHRRRVAPLARGPRAYSIGCCPCCSRRSRGGFRGALGKLARGQGIRASAVGALLSLSGNIDAASADVANAPTSETHGANTAIGDVASTASEAPAGGGAFGAPAPAPRRLSRAS